VSASNHHSDSHASAEADYRIPPESSWSNAWKIAAGIGVVGLAAAGAGYASDPKRFAFSYLFGFIVALTIALGSLFFVLVERLTSAGWSVTIRRTAEFFAAAIPILAILFIPIWLSMGHLFPWFTHESSHVTHVDPEHILHAELMTKKSPFLNQGFFTARAILYFILWSWIALRLFAFSTNQDKSKDPKWTLKAQAFAPAATFLFGLSLTFAAFDWVMSLEPSWYSTIFGVYMFAGCVVVMFATLTVVTMALRASGLLGRAITVEHYHDLGKLLFGFNVFWAYIGFSQFMLIWYASIPEETTWYHRRWDEGGPWAFISLLILFAHFIVPFFMLISRNAKRALDFFGVAAGWMILMHVLDIYWFVMPNFASEGFRVHWMDGACLFGVGGVYLAAVFYRMTLYPLIPVGDPRLTRCMRFENA